MRLVFLPNNGTLNAEHITRTRYIAGATPELTIWYLGAAEPYQLVGEAANEVRAAILDAGGCSPQGAAHDEPPTTLRDRPPLALSARLDRVARECRDEADEPELTLATRNLLREAAVHLSEAARRMARAGEPECRPSPPGCSPLAGDLKLDGVEPQEFADECRSWSRGLLADITDVFRDVPAVHHRILMASSLLGEAATRLAATAEADAPKPSGPVMPRRFRWPRGDGGWYFGAYFPRQDRFECAKAVGEAVMPMFQGLEWIDPAPEGAQKGGGA